MLERPCPVPTTWHTLPYHSVLSALQLASLLIAFTENMAFNPNIQTTNAAAEDSAVPPALEIKLHQEWCKRSVFTVTPWTEVATKSAYVQACTTSKLRWCHLCKENHGPDLLCFEEQHMSLEHQDIFRDVLDQSLHFSWDTEGSHRQIFRLCVYFLIGEDHILPLFMNSLHPDYARFYDKYSYLEFFFEMAEARYDVLASFLLSYLNRPGYTLFVPPSVLFRATSLDDFMAAVRSLPNTKALTRKAPASAIHLV